MSNSYLQFSTLVKVTKKEQRWLQKEIEKRSSSEGEVDQDSRLDCETSFDELGLWIRSAEGGNIEPIADLMQAYLAKFHPERFFKMTWAVWCSRLRPDEFDGGAIFVTAKGTEWSGSWKFFNQMEERFKKAQKKAKANRKGSRQR